MREMSSRLEGEKGMETWERMAGWAGKIYANDLFGQSALPW
jgi:hypothetical protein